MGDIMDKKSLLYIIANRLKNMNEDEKRKYLSLLKFPFDEKDEVQDKSIVEQPIIHYQEQEEKSYFLH